MTLEHVSPAILIALAPEQRRALECAEAWDLSDASLRVQRRLGWSDAATAEAVFEYRKFMMMIALEPQRDYAMSEAIDEIWHQHILDTRDYGAMCEALVGGMIHHIQSPLDVAEERGDVMVETRETLARIFKGPASELWQRGAHAIAKCCSHVVAHAA